MAWRAAVVVAALAAAVPREMARPVDPEARCPAAALRQRRAATPPHSLDPHHHRYVYGYYCYQSIHIPDDVGR